jgi:hypothetical protein
MSVLESSGGRKIMSAMTYIFIGRIRGVDFKLEFRLSKSAENRPDRV